ncbi:hypothetical protein LCGC14_1578090 [marine sediment metagenome]|uniref:site-specific DNA-methyltransferase (cytosine-N(4)-specific) n=1 Tax=marine sediment metagenome TaxID=412755 RepID=A0A0F9IHQ0_9ZZZZ
MNKIIQGDALQQLKELPEKSINMCMTSPPYWALRDYGTDVETIWDGEEDCEHDWNSETKVWHGDRGKGKHKEVFTDLKEQKSEHHFCSKCNAWKGQLGLEPTFDLYIKHLCDIFDEVKRVLRDDGTCWINLGDTYNAGRSGGHAGGKKVFGDNENNLEAYPKQSGVNVDGIKAKSLVMIPFRFAIEMVNRGWILRNTIIWHKRNCMPSSVKDRFTVDFEYLFFFTKNKKYYFETQYEPHTTKENRPDGIVREREFGYDTKYPEVRGFKTKPNLKQPQTSQKHGQDINYDEQGRNKRTVWSINPRPFSEAHFAVYPEELCETPIKAGCPEFVCKKCGNPKRLIQKVGKNYGFNFRVRDVQKGRIKHEDRKASEKEVKEYKEGEMERKINEIVISKGCNCNVGFTLGIVLDPFFGAGTTGLVALKQKKKFIGIELNKEYIEIAKKRLKPFLEQEKLK